MTSRGRRNTQALLRYTIDVIDVRDHLTFEHQMRHLPTWLTKLKAVELHRLAVLVGTPCSGTKTVQTQGIHDALSSVTSLARSQTNGQQNARKELSLVSIDMGIRNLAYSHWTTSLASSTSGALLQYDRPTLQTWRKIDISSQKALQETSIKPSNQMLECISSEDASSIVDVKESFEPIDYASHAYDLVKNLLDSHQPTHVLIERQRFRSGGNAAVLEWTIRVGVFEGMLYAVLKSLAATQHYNIPFSVEPMLPSRVNRFWLQNDNVASIHGTKPAIKLTGKETKKAKIELVKTLLDTVRDESDDRLFDIGKGVEDMVQKFLEQETSTGRSRKKIAQPKIRDQVGTTPDISKRDDLADSLLQGLAWLHWQNNRSRLSALKQDAFGLTT